MSGAVRTLTRDASPATSPAEPWWTRSVAGLVAVAAVLAAVIVARNPEAFRHAQFWAEDGWFWYPNAYDEGLGSLLTPLTGYFQTLPRLVALASLAVPLAWAPTVFALACLAIQVAPPLFLISARSSTAWPDTHARLAFALLWVALPNTSEVFLKLPNEQWHLAALALLVLLSPPPSSRAGAAFDAAVLLLSGVSGPFCIVLAPIAAWLALRAGRTPDGRPAASGGRLGRAAIVCATGCLQLASTVWLAQGASSRGVESLGAGPRMLARIISLQVVLGGLLGQANMEQVRSLAAWQDNLLPVGVALAAAALAAAALIRGRPALRLVLIACGSIFGASLLRPQVDPATPAWPLLQLPGVGQRYYYLPMLGWFAALFALTGARSVLARAAVACLLATAAFGVWSDFFMPPLAPTDFAERARAFEAAPAGTTMTFPIRPRMELGPMTLTKH